MEVILLERVAKLGQMGEVVRVKDGFARNFLLNLVPDASACGARGANVGTPVPATGSAGKPASNPATMTPTADSGRPGTRPARRARIAGSGSGSR